MRDLIIDPIWKESEIGLPIPDSKHAISVALPTWDDVISYEEKKPECIQLLKSIYPRFGLNPLLKKISDKVIAINDLKNHYAWPYPNYNQALKAKTFCDKFTDKKNSFIQKRQSLTFLITNHHAYNFAKLFWQHTGLGASSREAAIDLRLEAEPNKDSVIEARRKIINRISKCTYAKSDLIHLTSSGMSALYTALEIIYKIFPKKPTLQIGFPYVDVLKLPNNIFYGADLILEENTENIEFKIKKINPSALIIELPSNPMLKCVDIKKISKIANKLNIPIICDDTIGSNLNIDSLSYSDIVFTSLTKIFAGSGEVLAGSLILNPKGKWIEKFKKALSEIEIPKLSDSDTLALEKSSRDIVSRVSRQNINCLKLKKRLENHNAISKVFHPENCPNFNSILKSNGGFGCLLSFELKGGVEKTKDFYNALKISKGPSLGTQFTLVCPYVLLAHYKELEWAQSYGVSPNLIRVSVGLEDDNHLWSIFLKALEI
tara:strand:+ start:1598 stop:3064 length:1467 start_codon:yes stop_codon:yes gene_type:complete